MFLMAHLAVEKKNNNNNKKKTGIHLRLAAGTHTRGAECIDSSDHDVSASPRSPSKQRNPVSNPLRHRGGYLGQWEGSRARFLPARGKPMKKDRIAIANLLLSVSSCSFHLSVAEEPFQILFYGDKIRAHSAFP